jgi:hypothetical protein
VRLRNFDPRLRHRYVLGVREIEKRSEVQLIVFKSTILKVEGSMALVEYRISQSYEDLRSIATKLRKEVVDQSKGLRWCWIAEWHKEAQGYVLGVKYEGKYTWVCKLVIIQYGRGPAAYEQMDRLNALEGLTHDEWWAIWNSGNTHITASLSPDGSRVELRLKGVKHRIEPGFLEEKRCSFETDENGAVELFSELLTIRQKGVLPSASGSGDAKVVDDLDKGDAIAVSCPGVYEVDPESEFSFSLTITLQTAADICKATPEYLSFDLGPLMAETIEEDSKGIFHKEN